MERPNRLVEDMKGMSLRGATTATATPTTSRAAGRTTRSAMATNSSGMGISPPVRRMERNKSGGSKLIKGGRAPPKRSQSQKIGRPAFNPVLPNASTPTERQQQQQQPTRGVNRSQSSRVKSTTRNAPSRSGSFQRRRVPDRTSSSSSLRRGPTTKKQHQHLGSSNATATTGTIETDDISVCDSVFTSISIATMDSIAVRKSQMPSSSNSGSKMATRIEFNDKVGYLSNSNSDEYESDLYEYEDELSVFSESWCSSESGSCEVLSDYEEEEMDGAILEDNEGEDEAEVKSPEIINKDKEEECTG